jgi:hypothetical protein
MLKITSMIYDLIFAMFKLIFMIYVAFVMARIIAGIFEMVTHPDDVIIYYRLLFGPPIHIKF